MFTARDGQVLHFWKSARNRCNRELQPAAIVLSQDKLSGLQVSRSGLPRPTPDEQALFIVFQVVIAGREARESCQALRHVGLTHYGVHPLFESVHL